MTLQERVKSELIKAMTEEVSLKKSNASEEDLVETQEVKLAMRTIISRYPELNKKKDQITDDDIIKLCKKITKDEKTRLLYENKHLTESDIAGISSKELNELVNQKLLELDTELTSYFIKALESYLPVMMTEQEVKDFINTNIDLSEYKNKMQAMKPVMKELKGKADGNLVKKILSELS